MDELVSTYVRSESLIDGGIQNLPPKRSGTVLVIERIVFVNDHIIPHTPDTELEFIPYLGTDLADYELVHRFVKSFTDHVSDVILETWPENRNCPRSN